MPAVQTFDEVLDQQLSGAGSCARRVSGYGRAHPGPARVGTAAAFGFFFVDDRRGAQDRDLCLGQAAVVTAGVRHRRPDAAVTADAHELPCERLHERPHRKPAAGRPAAADAQQTHAAIEAGLLSAGERQALHTLTSLGAHLDAGFSFDELRRAFRQLALAFHPDRHPACSDQERARLTHLFTTARDAYHVLARRGPATRH